MFNASFLHKVFDTKIGVSILLFNKITKRVERMEKGYIKLYRAIDDNELLANDNTCYIVFNRLLTHADRFTGAYKTGRFKLAALCNLKPTTLYAALKRLESSTMIRQRSDNKMTTIYICNWGKYQQDSDSTVTGQRSFNDTKQEREKEREYIDTKVSISKSSEDKDEIDSIFDTWKEVTGRAVVASKRQAYRKIVAKLIKEQGVDSVRVAIVAANYYRDKQYRPDVYNFVDMDKKWDKLAGWIAKDKSGKNTNIEDLDA